MRACPHNSCRWIPLPPRSLRFRRDGHATAGCANRCCTSRWREACCSRSITSWSRVPMIRTPSSWISRSTPRRAAVRRIAWPCTQCRGTARTAAGVARQRDPVSRGPGAAGGQGRFRDTRARDLQGIERHRRQREDPDIDDQALRAWFIQHRDKYDEPERFDFEEGALAGTPGEADVRAFVASLNGGLQGDARAGPARCSRAGRSRNIVQSYGDEFATELAGSAVGQWRALKAKDGSWRAVRLTALAPARPADYEAMRGPILQTGRTPAAPNSAPPQSAPLRRSTTS